MRNNPYDDPTNVQPMDVVPHNRERMEDLQPKPMPSQQVIPASPTESVQEESAEIRQEEALTFRYAIGKLNDFLQWFVAVLEITLLIRFILKLIGAAPDNLFAGFLYALTDIILVPFSTIVHSPSIHPNQAFEWSTLIGMAIYYLIFWAIRRFLRILVSRPEEPAS